MADLKLQAVIERAEAVAGHVFSDRTLLIEALTHSSRRQNPQNDFDYERLEFLGDALLQAEVSRHLFLEEGRTPGEMTLKRKAIVSTDGLSEVGNRLGIAQLVLTSAGIQPETLSKGLIADVVEAILAAVYLDAGREAFENLCERWFLDTEQGSGKDAKTELQELCLKVSKCRPSYATIPHQGSYVASVACPQGVAATGTGRSKKAAEQQAAKKALELFSRSFSGG